jgi:hypothetical protein
VNNDRTKEIARFLFEFNLFKNGFESGFYHFAFTANELTSGNFKDDVFLFSPCFHKDTSFIQNLKRCPMPETGYPDITVFEINLTTFD